MLLGCFLIASNAGIKLSREVAIDFVVLECYWSKGMEEVGSKKRCKDKVFVLLLTEVKNISSH